VRIFKNRFFTRFAAKEGISDEALKSAVDEMERGLLDADLGGEVYKKRIARAGAGKSGGYRSIVYYRSENRAFFVYGFAKSDRDNIGNDELRTFKQAARNKLTLTEYQIEVELKAGSLIEIL
jgi:hypothetical protein